ncbi:receptor-type tyrosine-protein phosphatase F-like [Stylophora pistillata]|uniref:receptor-type tyrosine-protein phosphatase F-like n=1 Tax=Stylophora pistillata TaxID=50429 RepID=UPI000C042C74|nr:receptor-type tyrosine-protein phosphatase F-like [Stylophora pistillata]
MAQFSLELCFRVAFLAVLLPLTLGACVDLDLGMGRGAIPNSNITASSIQSASTPAKHGRLNYASGSSWCAKTSERNPYLQIDLQTLHIVCAVSTQGNSQADQWVKTYKLQLSTDGTNWTDYKELGQVKVLEGNMDRNSAVKHVLYGVLTRYVRFVSQTQQGVACMRTEVFGVKQKPTCDSRAIGLADGGRIPDDSFFASSIYKSIYAAKYGRLNGTGAWAPKTTADPQDYLQIDLLNEYVICAVATQGNPPSQSPNAQEWTTEYKLRFSLSGTTFSPYNETKIEKVFTGNSGKTDTRKNSLKEFASAKFIHFLPTSYHNFKVLRVEAYGILLSKVPSRPPTAFNLTASSSTSITASWQLPPVFARHGTIIGFKLFYKKKGSDKPARNLTIRGELTLSKNVTGLDEYTEYEFQVLAYSSDGDGPNSSVEVERTMEDVPSQAPSNFTVTASTSSIVTTYWQLPPVDSRNGLIIGFKLFYKNKTVLGSATMLPIIDGATHHKMVTGLDKHTEYEFQVLAYTSVGDGPKSSPVMVRTMKDGGCVEFYLGMENRTIPDNKVAASSEQSANTPSKNGRLHYTSGSSWCARASERNPYLQIDLRALHIICAVSTQGNSKADQWVKTYKLQLSTDGTTWTDYKELGQVKVLEGNKDRNSAVKHVLYGVLTRYVRFLPKTHQGGVCMRTEVFGVKQKPTCDSRAIGLADGGRIPDDSFFASSIYKSIYAAKYGRLNGTGAWAPKTTADPQDYLQIDLLNEYVICAVATQGNPPSQSPNAQEWTTEYKLRFSLNGTTFFPYIETKIDKVFTGNSGKTDKRKNSLKEFASAKFIRFLPTSYHGFKVLRVEAYGILLTKVPSRPPTAFNLTASSSTSVKATWQLPPVFARHGAIVGFKLFYKKKGSDEPARNLTIRGELTLDKDVTGLDEYTEYEFQVLAYSSDGDGPNSSVEVERTMEDAPSRPPSNFRINGTSSTSVTASWQLPPKNYRNGIIRGFKLFYKKKASSGSGTILSINSEAVLDKVVTGLDIYTEYEFQVLAFTSAGDGVNSSLVVERTGEDVPSRPPDGFTLNVTSSISIIASWQLPPKNSRNGIIRGFKLYYKKKGSSGAGRMQSINNQATHNKVVTGLEKYTEYEFQVLAFTSVGDGPKSSVKISRTKEDAPSRAPTNFSAAASSSTSITASWLSPPENFRHGIVKGFKLFYKMRGSSKSAKFVNISGGDTLSTIVTSLHKYTEYELQVSAYTSVGDGPKSHVEVVRTEEDAPNAPTSFSYTDVPPGKSHGPRITLTWRKPEKPNGVIRSYTLFYSHSGDTLNEISGIGAQNYTLDVLGGVSYRFHIRAVTIKPGQNMTETVTSKEYEPSFGPDSVSSSQVQENKRAFNISWAPLPREKSNGKVILYEAEAIILEKENVRKGSVVNSPSANTSATFVVLSDFELCSKYDVAVRAYTAAGPGPYGEPSRLETSRPEPPGDISATDTGTTQVTLTWKQTDKKEKIVYTVKYSGTKSYNKTFKDNGKSLERINTTSQTVKELIPGTTYKFEVSGSSVCGVSGSRRVTVTTEVKAPEAPFPHNVSNVEVSKTSADIYLWPVEQKYGPISAYQIIVLKVVNGVEELPDSYDSQLKAASDARKDDVNFYIAAEIKNVQVHVKPWKFTVGNGKKTENYVNEKLEKGEKYTVYERALTDTTKVVLKGEVSRVAKIVITSINAGGGKKEKSSGSPAAAVAVPVVLLLLLIPGVVVAVFLYRRRRQSRSKSASERRSVQLDDLKSGSQDLTSSTSNLVYQNIGDIRRTIKGAEQQPVSEEKEAIYSEADDGKPKPIPVAEFVNYFKHKSKNGAIVLREEFKYLPGGMQFSWEIGKSNRGKNRYGNIVSYDHSRVLLEEIEGDTNSSYINASYIPTYDEVSMTYIATQGPTSSTIADFWRMVWQENISTVVMLTNLVELGKGKCDQYWPDDTFRFGAITVTLHKTETFADYVIRSLIVTKDAENRNVQQFHYVTWPDKGVPHHSTALLGFRQKIHARHLATGGPLLVHCSAGVGRTGTYIAIDAMLESAEKIKTVFIQNYVQVMRKSRPHMIQKDDQYVFLHQAVMEALVCGNTEIVPQDLRITMNKLTMVHKSSKKTGYEQEFKRLELVTDAEASQEEAKQAFMPANVVKNRFPNVVPLDSARVLLQASSQDKSYINASFVDDYKQRNAYILTQAPLDNTILDLWQMISQYDIGTVVMLNNLKEGKQNYPQYWPSKESAKYGEVTVQLLSQETSNNITTRRFSVENAAVRFACFRIFRSSFI